MKYQIKKLLKSILGQKNLAAILDRHKLRILRSNFIEDYLLYKKHSTVFWKTSFEKKESEITLLYHSIEKGLLYNPIRHRFAKEKIVKLITLLEDNDVKRNYFRSQIQSAITSLINYYKIHKSLNVDVSDFFSYNIYSELKDKAIRQQDSTKNHTRGTYFNNRENNFELFSNSRCSVRNFTGELISQEIIQKVIDLSNNAPSVCNRQPVSVYLLQNKKLIEQVFDIQGGLKGYTTDLNQVLIVTSNRNYFYSIGERNQLYIDGGIYLMNLLYALHYYKIAACPAHWGMPVSADKQMRKLLGLPESFQIICLIAIGIPTESFKTTLSLRKSHKENLIIVN